MQTSAQLGLWFVYRHSAVLLAERLIAMESDTMVAKAAALIAEVEPEVSWIVAAMVCTDRL